MTEPLLVVQVEDRVIRLMTGKPDEIRTEVLKLGYNDQIQNLAVVRVLTRKVKEVKLQKKLTSNLEPVKIKPKKQSTERPKPSQVDGTVTFNPQADWQQQFANFDRSQQSVRSCITKEEVISKHRKGNPEQAFERLWYHATEGQKQKHQFLDAVFHMAHPFHPDIGSNKRLKLDSTREDFISRLTYSRKDPNESSHQERHRSPQTNWRRLGRSQEVLDDHSRRRADKMVVDLLAEIDNVKPKKFRFAPEVGFLQRTTQRPSSSRSQRRGSIHKSEVDPREKPGSNRKPGCDSVRNQSQHESSCYSRTSNTKVRPLTHNMRTDMSTERRAKRLLDDPEGFLFTDRYRKLLGLS